MYHWGVDNYGDGSTPVFGRQIAAFQGHHQRPWTITQREFANNLHQVCLSACTRVSALEQARGSLLERSGPPHSVGRVMDLGFHLESTSTEGGWPTRPVGVNLLSDASAVHRAEVQLPVVHAVRPQVFQPAAYPAAGMLAVSHAMPMAWNAWASSFLFLVCMSQQFHAWSHMKKSELHPIVVALQVGKTCALVVVRGVWRFGAPVVGVDARGELHLRGEAM